MAESVLTNFIHNPEKSCHPLNILPEIYREIEMKIHKRIFLLEWPFKIQTVCGPFQITFVITDSKGDALLTFRACKLKRLNISV